MLARISVIPYLALNQDALLEIVALKLKKIEDRLATQYKIKVTWGKILSNWLANQCHEIEMGARNIDLVIRKQVMPNLSQYILEHLADHDFAEQLKVEFDTKKQHVKIVELK